MSETWFIYRALVILLTGYFTMCYVLNILCTFLSSTVKALLQTTNYDVIIEVIISKEYLICNIF